MAPKKHDAKVVRSFSINPSLLAEVRSAAVYPVSAPLCFVTIMAVLESPCEIAIDPSNRSEERRVGKECRL